MADGGAHQLIILHIGAMAADTVRIASTVGMCLSIEIPISMSITIFIATEAELSQEIIPDLFQEMEELLLVGTERRIMGTVLVEHEIMCSQTVREMYIREERRMVSGNSVQIDNGRQSPMPLRFQEIWTGSNRCATGVRSGHRISKEPKVILHRQPGLLEVEVDHPVVAEEGQVVAEEEINDFTPTEMLLNSAGRLKSCQLFYFCIQLLAFCLPVIWTKASAACTSISRPRKSSIAACPQLYIPDGSWLW